MIFSCQQLFIICVLSGTLEYAPPEKFRHGRYYAGPATVWSLGVTLYEILCNKRPFKTTKEIIKDKLVIPPYLSEGKYINL
ncbi:MAG: protein kinase domain-containing protein, partial [Aeromonas sp.]